MPIEIKELHIKVVVNTGSAEPVTSGTPNNIMGNNANRSAVGDKESIVAECVEQVLDILQHKRER